jgi:hypothetical protein
MEHTNLRKFIEDRGYRTMSEISLFFKEVPEEILLMNVDLLVEKNMIRKVTVQTLVGTEDLCYIPG